MSRDDAPKYKKCTATDICKWLRERTENYSKQRKGLLIMELFDVETMTPTRKIPGYSRGKDDKFLSLNFCPFCGFSFYEARGDNEPRI